LEQTFHVDSAGKIFNYAKEGTRVVSAHSASEVAQVVKQQGETLNPKTLNPRILNPKP
jgi:hypothetical protein